MTQRSQSIKQVRVGGRVKHSDLKWRHIMEEFKESSLGPSAFCSQKGISLSTFYQWLKKRKIENPPSAPSFIPIRVDSDGSRSELSLPRNASPLGAVFTLHFRDDLRLKIEEGFHGPTLRRIFETLTFKGSR